MPKPINQDNQHLFAMLGAGVAQNWGRLDELSQKAILDAAFKVLPWSDGSMIGTGTKQKLEALISENDD